MDNDPKIISGKPFAKEIHPRGLGCAFYDAFKTHQPNAIAQASALTGEKQSFEELFDRCIRAAIQLRKRNVAEGDVVGLCVRDEFDGCVPFIAAAFLGCLPASFDPMYTLDENKHLLAETRPKIMFVTEESVEVMREAADTIGHNCELVALTSFAQFIADATADDVARFEPVACKSASDTCLIAFTSGSTGYPKGICLPHRGILRHCHNNANEPNVTYVFSNLCWISGIVSLVKSIACGLTRILCPNFDCVQIWNWIETFKIEYANIAPHLLIECLQHKPKHADTSALKYLLTGGSAVPKKQLQEFKEAFRGIDFVVCYGQTEAGGGVLLLNLNTFEGRFRGEGAPVGFPVDGFHVKIVDPKTEETLGPYRDGELRIKSDFVMNGYYDRDTSARYDEDGWYKTEDVFYYDDQNLLYFVDRARGILIYRQYHVVASMLEAKIRTHPAVLDAAVIGRPHEVDGEHPMACVTLRKDCDGQVTAEEIQRYTNDIVDDIRRLRGGVRILKAFPMTTSNKINKRALRKMVKEGLL